MNSPPDKSASSKRSEDCECANSTKERILRAAATAFAERGFEGATFRDIGADAGVNFQSIRYHFGSKEDLWQAVVERLSSELSHAIFGNSERPTSLSLRDQFKAQVRSVITYHATHPELQRILLRESMKGSERMTVALRRHISKIEINADEFLEQAQREGVLNPNIKPEDLLPLIRGAINYRLVTPGTDDTRGSSKRLKPDVIERHIDAVTRIFLGD